MSMRALLASPHLRELLVFIDCLRTGTPVPVDGDEAADVDLVDADAAVNLVREFEGQTAFVIIKHTNACGVATGSSLREAYLKA